MVSMRIQRLVVAVSVALVCALPTGASQSALTEDEYEAAMSCTLMRDTGLTCLRILGN